MNKNKLMWRGVTSPFAYTNSATLSMLIGNSLGDVSEKDDEYYYDRLVEEGILVGVSEIGYIYYFSSNDAMNKFILMYD